MGSFQIIIFLVSMLLVLIAIISIGCLLKSSWPKGIAGVGQEGKNNSNRGYKFLGLTKISGTEGNEVFSWKDRLWQNKENQPAFTDSWKNGLDQNDDTHSTFKYRAFH